ncbi:MAG: BON domain-containing protein [Steroidobacteraceae bacterium]|nr:BON domain-containing protein [Steroidobacteraceae bacterium]
MQKSQRIRHVVLSVLMAGLMATTGACTATRTQKTAGEQLDDTVVTARVKAALVADPVTKARQIDVEVFRGKVQLNGFVDSQAEKAAAARVARGVQGVDGVQNNLEVRTGGAATAGEIVDDTTLTARVKAALVENDQTKAHQINVAASNGVVQLSGFVDSASAKSAASQVARTVDGVKSVRNDLDVK